ncbi:MAG: efflux RND transporter permease subunit [Candidatus Erginobacter occultus]|nr:efflux RND transporter permease subunit [Candidatus Erginobacter occultus]
MKIGDAMVGFALRRPKTVVWSMAGSTLILLLLALLPTLWPGTFPFLHSLRVDTDPENMLPADEPVRVFHNRMKGEMALHEMVVLGVVNRDDPDGVFNPETLGRVFELTEFARGLRWERSGRPAEYEGVIEVDLIAPSTVERIEQAGPGTVSFKWLMEEPPATREAAREIRAAAARIPFLQGTLLSENGRAVAIYLPLTSKDISYRVAERLREKIRELGGDEEYHITGLPVAQDTFGVEMFKQMAIAAPAAMLIIFLLLLFFFRKLTMIVSPLIVALVAVIATMSLLVITGRTVHIMSSMIPIFIMPIAVLDAVHILSDFFDRYRGNADREKTVREVMATLFTPMLYTSLTTTVGFASLALAPIPPVQVFGLYIALGVLIAWLWTIIFIPAYIVLLPAAALENFGRRRKEKRVSAGRLRRSLSAFSLVRFLAAAGRFTYRRSGIVLLLVGLALAGAAWGISRIVINDNPTKWFSPSHPIRVADRVLNEHFAGTYPAYLALTVPEAEEDTETFAAGLSARLEERGKETAPEVFARLRDRVDRWAGEAADPGELLDRLSGYAEEEAGRAATFTEMEDWDEALLFIDRERQRGEVFKRPEVLSAVERLQERLEETGVVGKSSGVTDIVKTVYRDLISGADRDLVIPDTGDAVGQTLITFQNSRRPHDLWHFVTPDYRTAVLWLQLKSGDNRDMEAVVQAVDEYLEDSPLPAGIGHRWFGLTYINVVWQKKMVAGMLQAFLGSFLIVFLMMTLLYRSALWGMLAMIPLTVTIALIYGMIGLLGKDYDMPVAVLSSLSLGLAVDYAIHFLSRTREIYPGAGSWKAAFPVVFGEPARAISRNVIVVGLGFLPLVLAPLVPYQTVGIFIASILIAAGVATIFILPALFKVLEKFLFPRTAHRALICRRGTCLVSAAALVAVVAVNLKQFFAIGWTSLSWWSLGAVIVLAGACFLSSRRDRCRAWMGRRGEDKS